MGSRRIGFGIALLAIVGFSTIARAEEIMQSVDFSAPNGFAQFNAFDPSLGTLTAVNLTITGSIVAVVNTPVYIINDPFPEPMSYPFTLAVQEGLGGPLTASPNAQYLLQGLAAANDPIAYIPIDYTDSVEFNATTDLDGSAVISVTAQEGVGVLPPALAFSKLANFVGPPGQTFQITLVDLFEADNGITATGVEPVSINSFSGEATLMLDYTYTVPEARGLACFAIVLPLLRRRVPSQRARHLRWGKRQSPLSLVPSHRGWR